MIDVPTEKAIRKAIKGGDLAIVAQLLGDNKERLEFISAFGPWLHVAARSGHLDIVKWLVSKGADIDAVGGISNARALDEATSGGHLPIVEYLVNQGAKIDTTDPVRNPLFSAIVCGRTEIAKLLIEKGIDTKVRYTGENMKNMDALEFSRQWGRLDICKLIEDANKMAGHGN